jgi:hypothetical protein
MRWGAIASGPHPASRLHGQVVSLCRWTLGSSYSSEHRDPGVGGEPGVLGHLLTVIPGQRAT